MGEKSQQIDTYAIKYFVNNTTSLSLGIHNSIKTKENNNNNSITNTIKRSNPTLIIGIHHYTILNA